MHLYAQLIMSDVDAALIRLGIHPKYHRHERRESRGISFLTLPALEAKLKT